MTDVDELVSLFHSMDKEAQEFTLATARSQARLFPARRPSLRLVAGQGVQVTSLRRVLGSGDDTGAPSVG